jgi:3-oxoacyl-[acyl-carrier protein] reductase
MKREGGNIINVSSILATFPNTSSGAYGAAKNGLVTLTRVWAAELAPYDIRVNCYAPGVVNTPMMSEIFVQHREESKLSQIPLRRFGESEDIFKLLSFLCSEQAEYITGQTIGIDGGMWATQTPTIAWNKK